MACHLESAIEGIIAVSWGKKSLGQLVGWLVHPSIHPSVCLSVCPSVAPKLKTIWYTTKMGVMIHWVIPENMDHIP